MRNFLSNILLLLAFLGSPAFAEDLSGGPFTVHFQSEDRNTAEKSLKVLLDAAAEFEAVLPLGTEEIEVHIAPSEKAFDELAPNAPPHVTGITQSWRSHIVVKAPRLRDLGDDYAGTLRHELVHVLLYRNTNTDHMPRWLNEGISMSLANEVHWDHTLQMARMMMGSRLIAYKDLDRALQAPRDAQQFSDAYTESLSLTRHQRNELGEEAFWGMVSGMRQHAFPDALRGQGMTPQELWTGYQASLRWTGLVGMLTSGSLFAPAAILVIIAYFRLRRRDRKTLKQWEAEEAEDDGGPQVLGWDDVAEDPDAWKER